MTTTTLQELKPSQIKPHKANPRHDVGDVTELAASIAEQGILEPLIVAPSGEGPISGQLYTLIAGHRRLAGAKVAKCKTVLCLVRADLTDPQAQLEAMLVENLQRTDLTPVEEAEAYQQLLDFPGYTQTRIAKTTGRSIATVKARLKLATLPKGAREKIHAGQITLGQADALVEFAGDKAAFARLERSTASPAEFGRNLQDLRNSAKARRAKERAEKKLTAAGVRIIPAPNQYDWHAHEALKHLYSKAEIDGHRECPGFAAYISVSSYSGTSTVEYVCDQPGLHGEQDKADAVAKNVADEEQTALLRSDATARRTWIRESALQAPSDGLVLDILRQLAHRRGKQVYGKPENAALDEILGAKIGDAKDRGEKIDHLDPDQLVVLLDLIDKLSDEVKLEHAGGWGTGGGTYGYRAANGWRTRLTGVYGYTWSAHEQQMLDQGIAEAAEQAARDVDPDDDDELDPVATDDDDA